MPTFSLFTIYFEEFALHQKEIQQLNEKYHIDISYHTSFNKNSDTIESAYYQINDSDRIITIKAQGIDYDRANSFATEQECRNYIKETFRNDLGRIEDYARRRIEVGKEREDRSRAIGSTSDRLLQQNERIYRFYDSKIWTFGATKEHLVFLAKTLREKQSCNTELQLLKGKKIYEALSKDLQQESKARESHIQDSKQDSNTTQSSLDSNNTTTTHQTKENTDKTINKETSTKTKDNATKHNKKGKSR